MKLQRQNSFLDYEGFVEKFEAKKTTDDCYTPQSYYDALGGWLREHVPAIANATEWVRPFWPGGDYESYDYPEGGVVVDNPPFSILARIVDTYLFNNVRFWLFAPHLTLFNHVSRPGLTAVVCGSTCTYENGAVVNTSFLTNVWPTDCAAVIAGSLYKVLTEENSARIKANAKPVKMVNHSEYITSSALLGKVVKGYEDIELPRNRCQQIRKTDNGVSIFGGGLILSEGLAAELRAAELRAAELRAAELRAAELRAAAKVTLSANEKMLIAELSKNDPKK